MLWLALLFGSVWGSFLNVCIHRIPAGESVVVPPSRCPGCKNTIAWRDNIPVLGWLLLKGRCRHCETTISPIYPAIEALAAVMTMHVVMVFGLSWESLALVCLGYAFIVLMMIDFNHYILPDVITLPGIAIGIVLSFVPMVGSPMADPVNSVIGAVAGGGGLWFIAFSYEKITGKVGMGFGDVKLLALIGAWFGWQALPFTIFGAALMGSIVGLSLILFQGRDHAKPIPFGPYLVLAAWGFIFYGNQAYDWYLRGLSPGY